MFDSGEPQSTSISTPLPSTRWVAWMPLIFVGAFLYWSVALGLGGLSLIAASAIGGDLVPSPDEAPMAVEPVSGHASMETTIEPVVEPVLNPMDPIMVHLEESAEPEDVNDNPGAATPFDSSDDDGTGRLPAHVVGGL
jgi:hypothetical protein